MERLSMFLLFYPDANSRLLPRLRAVAQISTLDFRRPVLEALPELEAEEGLDSAEEGRHARRNVLVAPVVITSTPTDRDHTRDPDLRLRAVTVVLRVLTHLGLGLLREDGAERERATMITTMIDDVVPVTIASEVAVVRAAVVGDTANPKN